MPLQQPFDQRFPFGVKRGREKVATGALIPVVSVRGRAFLAMQVGVDGHAFYRFEFVNQRVSGGTNLPLPPTTALRPGRTGLWVEPLLQAILGTPRGSFLLVSVRSLRER